MEADARLAQSLADEERAIQESLYMSNAKMLRAPDIHDNSEDPAVYYPEPQINNNLGGNQAVVNDFAPANPVPA